MRMTINIWFIPPLYIASLICFMVTFVLARKNPHMIKSTVVLMLVAVFLSRMTFFGDTIRAVANVGLY